MVGVYTERHCVRSSPEICEENHQHHSKHMGASRYMQRHYQYFKVDVPLYYLLTVNIYVASVKCGIMLHVFGLYFLNSYLLSLNQTFVDFRQPTTFLLRTKAFPINELENRAGKFLHLNIIHFTYVPKSLVKFS